MNAKRITLFGLILSIILWGSASPSFSSAPDFAENQSEDTLQIESVDPSESQSPETENGFAPESSYKNTPIIKTGDSYSGKTIVSFDENLSINNHGSVAFIAHFDNESQGIFVKNSGDTFPVNITPGFDSTVRRFGSGLQINDANLVFTRDSVFGTTHPEYRIRTWNADGQDEYVVWECVTHPDLEECPSGVPNDHTALFGWTTMNNYGDYAFTGLQEADRFLADPSTTLFTYEGFSLRPMIADDGTIVATTIPLDRSSSTLRILGDYPMTTSAYKPGRSPGINDSGTIVGFYGEKNSVPGIHTFVKNSSGEWIPREVVSATSGFFSGFDSDARVAVNDLRKVAYIAFDANGKKGLYTTQMSHFTVEKGNLAAIVPISAPALVIKEGDSISGVGTVDDIAIYDPLNNSGQIAYWVKTTSGQEAIILAEETCLENDYQNPELAAYINQYDAGKALGLYKDGGSSCGPSSLAMVINAFNFSNGDSTRLKLPNLYSKTNNANNDFVYQWGLDVAKSLGHVESKLIYGKEGLDASLAEGIPVIMGTTFSSKACTNQDKLNCPKGGGHVILFWGRTLDGDYIVSDPAGNYMASLSGHYGAKKCGGYVIYPEEVVSEKLFRKNGKVREGVSIPLYPKVNSRAENNSVPVSNFSLANLQNTEVLLVQASSTDHPTESIQFWIEDSAGNRSGFSSPNQSFNDIPDSTLGLGPLGPSDPESEPEDEIDDTYWPYFVDIVDPPSMPIIHVVGELNTQISIEIIIFRDGEITHSSSITDDIEQGEEKTYEIEVNDAPNRAVFLPLLTLDE